MHEQVKPMSPSVEPPAPQVTRAPTPSRPPATVQRSAEVVSSVDVLEREADTVVGDAARDHVSTGAAGDPPPGVATGAGTRIRRRAIADRAQPPRPSVDARIQRRSTTGDASPVLGASTPAATLPIAQIRRSSTMIRRWWPFGGNKEDKKPVIGGPTNVKINGNDPKQELMSKGHDLATMPDTSPAPKPKAFGGKGGTTVGTFEEVAKPTVALGASAGAGIGANMMAHGTTMAGGAGGLGVLLAGDAALGLNNARKMDNEADLYGDAAMSKQAGRKAKDQGWGLGMGLASAGRGAAGVAQVATGAAATGTAAMAGAGLGIVGGGAMVLQGAWRGGQAVMKLCRLTWGRGGEVLSDAGARWKKVIVGAEKFKLAVNGLKIAAGALGVAAGALFIVSNPVGWAIGIAAAIAAAVYAGSKIIAKVSNANDKGNSKNKLDKQAAEDATKSKVGGPKNVKNADGGAIDLAKMGYDPAQTRTAGPQDRGKGFSQDKAPKGPDDAARKAAIKQAEAVAQDASANARLAAEMREALSRGDKEFIQAALQAKVANPKMKLGEAIPKADDKQLHDAFVLLSSINIDPDQALADSGQDMIEKKLSKAESM